MHLYAEYVIILVCLTADIFFKKESSEILSHLPLFQLLRQFNFLVNCSDKLTV